MACKVCMQLESAVSASRNLDSQELLLGLTEAGLRNRCRQKEEQQAKAESDLLKHQRSCSEMRVIVGSE